MSTRVLVPFYSTYGHTFQMARAVADGAGDADQTTVRLRRIPELPASRDALSGEEAYEEAQAAMQDLGEATLDDLRWADGICWGTPTRFGNMSAQMKQFLDTTSGLWMNGALEGKPAGVFTSTATTHGGQESTILTSFVPLLHHGMILVGTPYGENEALNTAEGIGGSPYGPGTLAGPDGSRQPDERELSMAQNLGSRVARVAARLK
ncbi:NAD(P)H:quinone oxidoreductase [Salinibacter altiplanensis]|uniref:NAD(P)H:quinone oxidoreductase n=1 Tax=Salinibacter altiplanensis TaxID=1803181 RepID=UPI000C9F5797|nr:NAD(P)H:quinone oxidoreductase [Salinibacter altiplanensis]